MECILCRELVENENQPEDCPICNDCAGYVIARFGPEAGQDQTSARKIVPTFCGDE